ncbi:MAG: YtxH domain-containing protein [Bacteroidetes bacterium]|nr:YtxH domain-containing protein [Bacteroidota bacterium]
MSSENGNGDIFEKVVIASLAFLGGVAVGMLFAPKSGKENRKWVKDKASNLGKKAEQGLNKVMDKMSNTEVRPSTDYADESEIYNESHKS